MTKYNTKLLKNECAERLETSKAFQVVGKQSKPRPEVSTLEEFAARGFRFGTPDQSWKALQSMAAGLAAGDGVTPEISLWFVSAMNDVEQGDIQALVRRLGFIEHGRSRVVNKFDLANRMIELVEKRGMVKAQAARQAGVEFNCSEHTALHWYKHRERIYNK